jgi:hypothetical protein
MANTAIADNIGYLEVENGNLSLYVEMRGITVMSLQGYLYNIFTYSGDWVKDVPSTVTPYSYITKENGSLVTEWDDPGLYYMKRISIPLNGLCNTSDGYYVSMIIPMMDSLVTGSVPGDGANEKSAYLLINRCEKLDDETNPFAGYDKSLLLGRLHDANALLPSLSASAANKLTQAIGAALIYYTADPTDSDEIKAAADILERAVASAENPPAAAIADVRTDGGNIVVTLDTAGISGTKIGGIFYAAYDAEGTLIQLSASQDALAGTNTYTLGAAGLAAGTSVKIFVWQDMAALSPVCAFYPHTL